MPVVEFREAIRIALDEELERDENVVLFGEDVALPGGVFAVTPGLAEKYGEERVFDTPISELAITGAAFGSAVCGMRPVIEIMFGDFMPLAMDGLVNQAAKYWFLSNEQRSVPLVVRSAIGAGGRFGAIHSQSPVPWFLGVPGLKIACPSNPGDARTLMKAAIRDDNPVLFFEHKRLYSTKGELNDDPIELGGPRVVRPGSDLTIVTAMTGVLIALEAAEALAGDGIDAEVIDLRVLRPFDPAVPIESLTRTNRLLVLEEGARTGGWSATVMAELAEHGLGDVDDVWRLTTADLPIPFSPSLEDAFLPSAESVAAAVRERLGIAVAS
jgi:pyruvate/2-oxoglutarate/acetoin dehydrogenase E1 component